MENKDTLKQDKKESAVHKLGDKIEAFGEKVAQKGWPKTGEAIHKAGDKIEHMQDEKPKAANH